MCVCMCVSFLFRWCPVLLCHLPSVQGGPFRAVQGQGQDHGGTVQGEVGGKGGDGRLRVGGRGGWMHGRGGEERDERGEVREGEGRDG